MVKPGDQVALIWGDQGAVGVKAGTPAAPPPASDAPPPPDVVGPGDLSTIDARPDRARTWAGGGWAADRNGLRRATQAPGSIGVYEYGPGMLQGDGHCVTAQLHIVRATTPGDEHAQITFGTHDDSIPPTLTAVATVTLPPGNTATVDLGPEVGQQMLDGHITGVGIHGDDPAALLGPDEHPLSGQLLITYTRRSI